MSAVRTIQSAVVPDKDDRWFILENGRLAERWDVVSVGQKSFTVKITEIIPAWVD